MAKLGHVTLYIIIPDNNLAKRGKEDKFHRKISSEKILFHSKDTNTFSYQIYIVCNEFN
jgi:hypothetical protein